MASRPLAIANPRAPHREQKLIGGISACGVAPTDASVSEVNLKLHAALVLFLGGAGWCAAQTDRLVFDFSGTDPARNLPWTTTSIQAPGWSNAGWILGHGLQQVEARDDRLAFSAVGSAEGSTLAEAIAGGQYLAVAIAGADLAGHRVSFTIRRESWHAPLRYAVRWSVDGFASDLFDSTLLENSGDATDHFTFLLPSTESSDPGGVVEFRIIPYTARYSGHPAALTAFSIRTAGAVRTLTLGSGPGGSAAVEPDRRLFEEGESVFLRATPDPGYQFAGWTGAVSGRGNPRMITITGDAAVTALFARKAPPRMELGGNLAAVTDYGTAWVFKNVFHMARPWLTREVGSFDWESHQTPPLDEDGWPRQIPFVAPDSTSHIAHTLVPLYDAGHYVVRFSGRGVVVLRPPGAAAIELSSPGGDWQNTVHLAPGAEARTLLLEIRESDIDDPVRHLAIIAPGEDPDLTAQPFHSAYLASLAPYRVLRFMDWLRTNGSPVEHWTDRTTPTSFTQARPAGVAHELIIQLCNLTGKDAWICLPHRADDDYVRQTARLYRDTLDVRRLLYVEYSNETWNYMPDFTQTLYVNERAAVLGITPSEFVARRSAEVFAIFAEEFGEAGLHRCVKVLGTQAGAFAGVTAPRVAAFHDPAINPGRHYPDAIAIAPYFGENYTPEDDYPSAEAMVTAVSSNSIPANAGFAVAHRSLADEQGMRLVTYEGGQHFTGIFGAENDDELTARIFAANRDPRMEDRYREFMAALQEAGIDLFMHFNHVEAWSKWGTWGALEDQQQAPSAAPKWRALLAWDDQSRQHRDEIHLTPPATDGTGWNATFPLRPGRSHSVMTSTNLHGWLPVEGLESLRGDAVIRHALLPSIPGEPRRFWRVVADD